MRNQNKTSKISESRRDFLRSSLAASAGAAAVAMAPKAMAAVSEDDEVAQEGSKGYHVTQHILDYYKSASV